MSANQKFVLSMLIFASMGLFVRAMQLPSSVIALGRSVLGALFLLALCIALKKKRSKAALAKNAGLLLASGIALGANWIFIFEAYKHTTIATATLSYYLAPVFIIVLSPLVLNEKITAGKLASVVISLLGMVLVSGILTERGQSAQDLLGICLGIAAALSYASLTLLNKFIKGLNSLESTVAQLAVAAVILIPYTLLRGDFTGIAFTGQSIALLLVFGVVNTGLGFWMYFSSIQELKAQTAAAMSYIDPIAAVLLSVLLLHEQMGVYQILGAILVLGSTFASERAGKRMEAKRLSLPARP